MNVEPETEGTEKPGTAKIKIAEADFKKDVSNHHIPQKSEIVAKVPIIPAEDRQKFLDKFMNLTATKEVQLNLAI
jgi:hypothetical protein